MADNNTLSIRVGFPSGKSKSMAIATGTTVQQVMDMFQDETGLDMNKPGHQIMHNSMSVKDYSEIVTGNLLSVKDIKGANDYDGNQDTEATETTETTETAEPVKKADLFTKEFVDNSSVVELNKAALKHFIDTVKAKNKHIQARRAEMLGEPRKVNVCGKMFETFIGELTDGSRGITSAEEYPWGGKIEFKALENETDEMLVLRFNDAK